MNICRDCSYANIDTWRNRKSTSLHKIGKDTWIECIKTEEMVKAGSDCKNFERKELNDGKKNSD